MWPIANTQTFIDHFESNGLEQAECSTSSVTAGFESDATVICQNEMIYFTDVSAGDVTSWNWTFEGGDPANSAEQNPVVAYNTDGTFDVTLEVSDGTETNAITLEDYITVFENPETLLTAFEDVCDYDPAFELTGGSPEGGFYEGPGVVDGWFYPEQAGLGTHTISYTYIGNGGCQSSVEETILVDECVSVTEFDENTMKLFPNPSTGVFEIEFNFTGKISIEILNIVGTEVYHMNFYSDGTYHNRIDLSGLESGIYFVTLKSSQETIVKKLQLLSE